jgi:addiction module HigA family antidote
MKENRMRPIHPGEVLREEFLVPMGLTAHALAIALMVPAPRIYDITRERRGITADTALRLARYFGTSVEFWLGLQSDYETAIARGTIEKTLEAIRPHQPAA